MASVDILADITSVVKLQANPGETPEEFVKRLAIKANSIPEADWASLKERTQVWANDVIEAVEKKTTPPIPPGVDKYLVPAAEEKPAGKPNKKEKASATPKEPKGSKKAVSGAARGPKGKYPLDHVITLKAAENPFWKGTKCYGWFDKIKDGATVGEAVEAGAPRNHIRWAKTLGHIDIEAPKKK